MVCDRARIRRSPAMSSMTGMLLLLRAAWVTWYHYLVTPVGRMVVGVTARDAPPRRDLVGDVPGQARILARSKRATCSFEASIGAEQPVAAFEIGQRVAQSNAAAAEVLVFVQRNFAAEHACRSQEPDGCQKQATK